MVTNLLVQLQYGNESHIGGGLGQPINPYSNDYLAKLTTFAIKKLKLINQLFEQNCVEANIQMIQNFPLKDDLSALAATNIAKLCKDYDKLKYIIQQGGMNAICEALSYMLISEIT
eukprot:335912_1